MKLKLSSINFETCEIAFIVPKEIMDNNSWGNVINGVDVDLSLVTDNAALGMDAGEDLTDTVSQQPTAEIGWCKEAFDFVISRMPDSNYEEMWRARKRAVLAQLQAISPKGEEK